jgi:ATP-dependent helicase HrpB
MCVALWNLELLKRAPPMLHDLSALPIDDVLPAIRAALEASCNLVVVAPPGAGKTTRAPLALLDADWAKGGKLILL